MTTSSVSPRIKFFYGVGQAAESIKNFGFGTLLLLYYNQVLGLSGTYSGIAVLIAVAFDAKPELTLRQYAHALPLESGDLKFADFETRDSGSERLYPASADDSTMEGKDTDDASSGGHYGKMERETGFASERSSRCASQAELGREPATLSLGM